MTNYLKIKHENSTIVMDRAFAKAASVVGSDQYDLLQQARRDYPKYKVITRSIKKKENKESYRGLTYEYMERYIMNHEDADILMKVYLELRFQAECHSIRYPHIKYWFLETYPEVKKFGMIESEQKEIAATSTAIEEKSENALSIVKGEAELQAA